MKFSKVIIPSFAKVGTQTIAKSLKIKDIEHVQSMIRLKRMLNERPNRILFCGIREFVGRNMSYFFQIIDQKTFNDVQCSSNDYKGELCFVGEKNVVLNTSIEDLINIFHEKINHKIPTIWFQDFFKLIEFDISKETFDKKRGYQKYVLKNNNILYLYRIDALNDFIAAKPDLFFNRVDNNIGAAKWYKDKYFLFKKQINFTDSYLIELLYNDIMKFFYTENEINVIHKNYKKYSKNGLLEK